MKAKKLLGLALSAVMAVSAVAPWTGMTAFAVGENDITVTNFTKDGEKGGHNKPNDKPDKSSNIASFCAEVNVVTEAGTPVNNANISSDDIQIGSIDWFFGNVQMSLRNPEDYVPSGYVMLSAKSVNVSLDYNFWCGYWEVCSEPVTFKVVVRETGSGLTDQAVKTYVLDPELEYPADGSDQGYQNYYPSAETGSLTYATGLSGATLTTEGWEALAGSDGKLTIGDQIVGSDLSQYVDVSGVGDAYKDEFGVNGELVPYVIKLQNAQGNVYGYDDNGVKADIHVDCYVADEKVVIKYHSNYDEATVATVDKEATTGDSYDVLDYAETGLPTRTGYEFKGWATSSNGTVVYTGSSVIETVMSGMDFYAVWEKEEEEVTTTTVTYHSNFDQDQVQSQLNNIGEVHTVLSYAETQLPTNEGYIFRGWATTADGEVAYTSGANTSPIETALDLYAVWEKSETTAYVVTHRFADGTPADVTFADNNTIVTAGYTEDYVVIPPQSITAGYTIDKIEVYKGEVLFTTYTGNYDYMGTNVSDAPVTLVYYVSEVEEPVVKYTVTHKFADGTAAEVTFAEGKTVVTEEFTTESERLIAQAITAGYTIDKIEVYKGDVYFTSYSDNYDYMYTYLKDAPVTLVYYVSKVEVPVDPTDPPELPDFSDPDDGNDEEIDDDDTPLSPGPGGEDVGETEEAVLVGSPDSTGSDEEIGEDDVPLIDSAPQTGVKVAGSLALLAGAAAIAVITFKKRKDQ